MVTDATAADESPEDLDEELQQILDYIEAVDEEEDFDVPSLMSTSEVGEHFDMTPWLARQRLRRLQGRGELNCKRTPAGHYWYIPSDQER